jgi:hypothetical protein
MIYTLISKASNKPYTNQYGQSKTTNVTVEQPKPPKMSPERTAGQTTALVGGAGAVGAGLGAYAGLTPRTSANYKQRVAERTNVRQMPKFGTKKMKARQWSAKNVSGALSPATRTEFIRTNKLNRASLGVAALGGTAMYLSRRSRLKSQKNNDMINQASTPPTSDSYTIKKPSTQYTVTKRNAMGTNWNSQDIKSAKKLNSNSVLVGSTLGLTALGTKGASARYFKQASNARKLNNPVASRLATKKGMQTKKVSEGALYTGAGLGGISGYNFAALQRAESRQKR